MYSYLNGSTLPQIVVFGTDYVLWPFYLNFWYSEFNPPFTKNRNGIVIDVENQTVPYYEDVPKIFEELASQNIKIGIVCRRGNLNGTEHLINLFGWEKYVSHTEFFVGLMRLHFQNIHEKSGIKYSDILYFDDISRNLEEANKHLEVYGVLLQDGLNRLVFKNGMLEYREHKRRMLMD